ncbi:MAG TPA: dihydrodipicolinate synthase family protein, partial [Sunxiuqinia sp.]|nr:dihydrodipicolinate synthase family protein [Sunxiuqinia sp.]
MTHPFKGAGVALVTPFKEDFSIDFNALEDIVEDQISNGIDYLVALGTTAETPTLSAEEQKEVVACIKAKNNKRVPLVLGMGGN